MVVWLFLGEGGRMAAAAAVAAAIQTMRRRKYEHTWGEGGRMSKYNEGNTYTGQVMGVISGSGGRPSIKNRDKDSISRHEGEGRKNK